MVVESWFPLAIYYEDLPESALHKEALVKHIYALRASSGEQRTTDSASWTGDIHGVDRVHHDPVFDWLTDHVGNNVMRYLTILGHDLEKMDVHIQRSWPVIAKKGQVVSPHAHNTAHVSSVYYVSIPGDGDPGGTTFFNDNRPNEISHGIGSGMTGSYFERNMFNYNSAEYSPVEGRLLLFPAKLTHSVEPNMTDDDRISVSLDLIITSREDQVRGSHEFLMPSPSQWKKVPVVDGEAIKKSVSQHEA